MFKKKNYLKVIALQGPIAASNKRTEKYKHYEMLETIRDIEKDDSIKGVLLRVNSPGGTAGASSELAMSLDRLRKKKPIVAHVSDMACSGALMASVAASKIVASPMAMIGSIGVIMQIPDFQNVAEKIGIGMRTFRSAEMKDIGNPFRDMTYKEKEYLQYTIDKNHEFFSQYVENHRHTGCIDQINDGKFFIAEDALKYKLIDMIGTYDDALNELLSLTGLNSAEIIKADDNDGLIDKIMSKLSFNLISSVKNEIFSQKMF